MHNLRNSDKKLNEILIAPAKHFITESAAREKAINNVRQELKERLTYLESRRKYLEAERLERRVKSDLAMMRELGYCHGIENYSRHLSGRLAGEPPDTLLNYFPKDFLTVIDESHITVPQIQGMFEGDASRKKTLIEYGFRLPSAADNRPLKFKEFWEKVSQVIYTSATPADYEKEKSAQIVEQIIRPTGLVDPKIIISPVRGQVQDLIQKIKTRANRKERVLVTTLTKRMAEDLTDFLNESFKKSEFPISSSLTKDFGGGQDSQFPKNKSRTFLRGIRPRRKDLLNTYSSSQQQAAGYSGKVRDKKATAVYLHSDVKTLDRIKILTGLRRGDFDVLVGVNLLREGLDLPEVSLVAILDADKEGFLRSATSLIQTIGRAARNVKGEVLIYADHITGSIKKAVEETERRRELQLAHNKKYGITPKTIIKKISDILSANGLAKADKILDLEIKPLPKSKADFEKLIQEKEKAMKTAARALNFELAAILRDEIKLLQQKKK